MSETSAAFVSADHIASFDRQSEELLEAQALRCLVEGHHLPPIKPSDKPWGTDADRGIYFNPKMRCSSESQIASLLIFLPCPALVLD